MDTSDGFVPITAMFYSVFHPTEGTKVIYQVPSGVIVPPENDDNRLNNNLPDSSALDNPLFDFDTIKNYVIPKPSLCNKLITLKIDNFRVLGFPVNIYAPHYARNSFGFNFCFVFPYDSDTTPYEGNIKRIGKMFRALEEQSQLLSKSLKDSHVFYQNLINSNSHHHLSNSSMHSKFNMNNKYLKIIDDWDEAGQQIVLEKKAPGLDHNLDSKFSSIESLIQQIFQDLNNYSECMIPIDASNSVDLKLFPISPPPPHIQSYDVPLALVKLNSLIDSLWDPTMMKIVPFINGVYSIAQISELSNANLDLTKECIRHLLHYQAITMLDIFQFSNRYSITSTISHFLKDPNMANECQDYILNIEGNFSSLPIKSPIRRSSNCNSINSKINEFGFSSSYNSPHNNPRKFQPTHLNSSTSFTSNEPTKSSQKTIKKLTLPSKATLFELYNALNSNLTVSEWYFENFKKLENIDIRKFITFGVRNGIIYRVHRYPVCGKFGNSSGLDENDANLIKMYKNKTTLNVLSLPVLATSDIKNNISQKTGMNENDTETSDDDEEEDEEEGEIGDDTIIREGKQLTDAGRHENEDKFMDSNEIKRKKREKAQEVKILRLIKHTQHMDSICTSMKMNQSEVKSVLQRIGDMEMIEM